jgi:hypothetical protein
VGHLLYLDSSLRTEGSRSRTLSARYAGRWRAKNPVGPVTYRDLAADPVPHLDGAAVSAQFTAPSERTPEQAAAHALTETLIGEVISGLLAAALPLSGQGKLAKDPRQLKTLTTVGFPENRLWLLASAEIAGAVGLVAGLFWWPIGVAAEIGVILSPPAAPSSHPVNICPCRQRPPRARSRLCARRGRLAVHALGLLLRPPCIHRVR